MSELVQRSDCPSIVFRLQKTLYTINSADVRMIMQMPACEPMPDTPAYVLGLVRYQGNIVPVFDLRTIFGMASLEKEYQKFTEMIDLRKKEHIEWATELERVILAKEKFERTTDPHQCAFGKWYDTFHSESNAVMFQLQKIDEPHKKLHAAADRAEKCPKRCEECQNDRCLAAIFEEVKEQYVPQICSLLDGAKEIMRDQYHAMILIISLNERLYGLAMDEVLSVEMLEDAGDQNTKAQMAQTLISGIKKSANHASLILELDITHLFQKLHILAPSDEPILIS